MADHWEEPAASSSYNNRVFTATGRGRGRGGYRDRGRGFGNRGRPGNSGDNQNWRSQRASSEKLITVPTHKVGRIIGKGGSKIKDLQYETGTRIKVGDNQGSRTDVTLSGTNDAIAKAVALINDLTIEEAPRIRPIPRTPTPPTPPPPVQKSDEFVPKMEDYYTLNEHGEQVVDWDKLNDDYDRSQQERFRKLPPLVKDFYKEDSVVAAMHPAEVAKWRKDNHDIQVKRTFDDKPGLRPIPNPVLTFEQAFQDYPEILEEIYKQGFKTPSPIQSQGWPVLLRGDDLIGIAQTGTGKTLAFLLPALIHIDGQTVPREERPGPTVLILAPTRELALQIDKEVSKYQYKGIKSVCLYGGGDIYTQIRQVISGVDIVIATPGRLNELIVRKHLQIIHFSYLILDEADRMLDMGFEPQIRASLFEIRPDHQTVMTSATWPSGVRRLAESYMKDPIQVNVGSLDLAAVHTVTQQIEFLKEEDKEPTLYRFIEAMDKDDKVIIFCSKKARASQIFRELMLRNIPCQALHGDRDQSDREAALQEMIDGTVKILVATDVASRGIDIKDLTHVINFDFPRHIEEYVHRVGRTGRAGKTGVAVTFIRREDWAHAGELLKILEEANQEVPEELVRMSERFTAMKKRRDADGGGRGGRGGRGFGNRDRW